MTSCGVVEAGKLKQQAGQMVRACVAVRTPYVRSKTCDYEVFYADARDRGESRTTTGIAKN